MLHNKRQCIIFFIFRRRFEATKCWVYEYDGLNPPPNAIFVTSDEEDGNINNSKKLGDSPLNVHEYTISSDSIEEKEFSSTFGLTAEETREFWDMILPPETGSGKL